MPRIEVLPLALETALAGCTLYPAGHTRQEAALDLVFKALSEILSAEGAITVGLSGDTLILNGTPLFEESAKATRFIDRLNERGVLSMRIDHRERQSGDPGHQRDIGRRHQQRGDQPVRHLQ